MSLEGLHTEVEGYRTEAGQLAEEYTRQHAEITSDQSLTESGKRDILEPLHQQTAEQMSALHAREKAAVQARKEKLEREVFGLSTSASNDPARLVSFRDAQARARELDDSDDAADLYESAKRSGDTVLAAAVMERSLVRGWSKIKDDYLSRNPTSRNTLDDLTALAKYTDNTLATTAQYMAPSSNLPRRPAGFAKLGGQTTARAPRKVPDLGDIMAQRLGTS